jgi:cytochrome o ubiquinol oxidase subunit III
MTIATTLDRPLIGVPTELARGRGGGGPAPKRIVVAYGFWIFILSDMIMFSTCGIGVLSAERGQPTLFLIFAIFTFALGAAFLFIEVTEFAGMVAKGAGPSRSAFLSSFFTLVGTHGVHVASGLIALIYLMAQVLVHGLQAAVLRRLLCWSLFWHALDIVWVGVFTLVYLMGVH